MNARILEQKQNSLLLYNTFDSQRLCERIPNSALMLHRHLRECRIPTPFAVRSSVKDEFCFFAGELAELKPSSLNAEVRISLLQHSNATGVDSFADFKSSAQRSKSSFELKIPWHPTSATDSQDLVLKPSGGNFDLNGFALGFPHQPFSNRRGD